MAPISWLSLSIPKAGNTVVENEDAVFPISGVGKSNNGASASFLVADGATQTSFSGLWARILVDSCANTNLSEGNFFRAVRSAQGSWHEAMKSIELPWHAQEKLRQGAYSALTWLEIKYYPLHPAYAFIWNALAVGDCCLFIARNREFFLSLPIQDHRQFSLSPVLIPSKSEKIDSIKGCIQTARGSLKMGDQLLLGSDAISSWLMRRNQEEQLEFLKMLLSTKKSFSSGVFENWIKDQRRKKEIKNDDTSLIFIELGETE